MTRGLKIRIGVVVAVVVVSLIYVYPTVKLLSLSDDEKARMEPRQLASLKDKALKLGLDLQGGMHLVLAVDRTKLDQSEGQPDVKNLVSRAEAIIRNRVDKFGVAEPIIQTEGEDRILIQLAGLTDESRAKELVGQTALLEFKLVRDGDEFRRVMSAIDDALKDEIRAMTADETRRRLEAELEQVAAETDTAGLRQEIEAEAGEGTTLASMVDMVRVGTHEDGLVKAEDLDTVRRILQMAEERRAIPQDVQFVWHNEAEQGPEGKFQRLYLVARKASLTGKYISSAIVRWGLDAAHPSSPGVSLEFNRVGRSLFAKVTGENVDRRLAIILDDKIHSAPNINEKIRGGPAAISGSFTADEARALAIVLEAGALPAPLDIVEERTVGPSLGSDSIRSGIRSALIGGIGVVLFMVLYYGMSGLFADIALLLNLVILLAAMSILRGTLTLPGIAGVILTIGMAVDANVLIYERIREELRAGKTVRRAIADGYQRAFVTILDSNLTTIITAVVLYQFGTGPIRGFAVTLTIGIAASMFTAIVVTRVLFDLITATRTLSKLSI